MPARSEDADPQNFRALTLCIAGALLAWGGFYIARTSFVYEGSRVFCLWDDGMISMTYARNLARGAGLVWNAGGEAVQGYSNPGVTLVMSLVHLLPIDAFKTSLAVQCLALALLVGSALVSASLARRLFGEASLGPVAALSVACSAPFAFWTLQGSDVGFIAFWLLGCVWWLTARGNAQEPWPAGLFALLAIGPVLRPDSVIFVAVFGAAALALPGRRVPRVLRGGALLGAVGAAMLLFNWQYYGDLLPNTYYLKATGADRAVVIASGLAQLGDLLPGLLLLLGLAAAGTWVRRADPRVLLCAGLSLSALLYHVWVGGDWAPERGSRFTACVLPLLGLLATAGARALLGARTFAIAASVVVATLAASNFATLQDWFDPRAPTFLRDRNLRNLESALYIRDHTDPDVSMAVSFGGVYPYFGEREAIDVWGKSDRHIAKLPVEKFVPGHSKSDWVYVIRDRRPDLISGAFNPNYPLMRRAIFRNHYLRAIKDQRLYFYVRRDSLSKVDDPDLGFYEIGTGVRIQPGDVDPADIHADDVHTAR